LYFYKYIYKYNTIDKIRIVSVYFVFTLKTFFLNDQSRINFVSRLREQSASLSQSRRENFRDCRIYCLKRDYRVKKRDAWSPQRLRARRPWCSCSCSLFRRHE